MVKRCLGWLPLLTVALFLALPVANTAHAQDSMDSSSAQMSHEQGSQGEMGSEGMDAPAEMMEAGEGHEAAHGGEAMEEEGGLGGILPLWSALPFVGILLSIALFPLFAPSFWHHHYPKISAFWALLFAIPFLFAYKGEAFHEVVHIYLVDYIPFIILLLGLFTASGGILLRGTLVGTPRVNLIFLVIGTILASWMGTTGAAMVLIRPLIRANRNRKTKMHVVIFFIFLVANIGGSLTPLGDPPLFLGFLHGVPFFWTFHIMPEFLTAAAMLLVIFFIIDTILYKREGIQASDDEQLVKQPIKIEGLHNLFFLLGVVVAVLFSGMVHLGEWNILGVHVRIENEVRDVVILLMAFLSWKTTKMKIRSDNGFTWFPIVEVAYLFAGIFMTIIPALAMLQAGEHGHLAMVVKFVREPFHFFWVTGALSSFLDNAPTYLTFYNLAQGKLIASITDPQHLAIIAQLGHPDRVVNSLLTGAVHFEQKALFVKELMAISAGAVFFGAMTYIGNAPNFMVRSIAEENEVKMPSFFGYMLWSLGILVPVFLLITLIFFL